VAVTDGKGPIWCSSDESEICLHFRTCHDLSVT
jgi:hypothetical protein